MPVLLRPNTTKTVKATVLLARPHFLWESPWPTVNRVPTPHDSTRAQLSASTVREWPTLWPRGLPPLMGATASPITIGTTSRTNVSAISPTASSEERFLRASTAPPSPTPTIDRFRARVPAKMGTNGTPKRTLATATLRTASPSPRAAPASAVP